MYRSEPFIPALMERAAGSTLGLRRNGKAERASHEAHFLRRPSQARHGSSCVRRGRVVKNQPEKCLKHLSKLILDCGLSKAHSVTEFREVRHAEEKTANHSCPLAEGTRTPRRAQECFGQTC